jgi:hypothetical protein
VSNQPGALSLFWRHKHVSTSKSLVCEGQPLAWADCRQPNWDRYQTLPVSQDTLRSEHVLSESLQLDSLSFFYLTGDLPGVLIFRQVGPCSIISPTYCAGGANGSSSDSPCSSNPPSRTRVRDLLQALQFRQNFRPIRRSCLNNRRVGRLAGPKDRPRFWVFKEAP